MLRSVIKILHASLVQIDAEMTEKYANQRYAVPLLHYDDLFPIYGLLRVAVIDRLALLIGRLYTHTHTLLNSRIKRAWQRA